MSDTTGNTASRQPAESNCPLTGEPCPSAGAAAEYILSNYIDRPILRPQAFAPLMGVALNCVATQEECGTYDTVRIDEGARQMRERLSGTSERQALDERGVELIIKAKDPIDRALMWVQLLPGALAEAVSFDEAESHSGLLELTRIRDAFHEVHGTYLAYPLSRQELQMYYNLAVISEGHLQRAFTQEDLLAAADSVNCNFANKYMKPEDNPKLAAAESAFRMMAYGERIQEGWV